MFRLSPRRMAFAILASSLCACAAPQNPSSPKLPALDAPIVTPPSGTSLNERIMWWEDRLYMLNDADRAEGYMRLGRLYLSHESSIDARRCFRLAKAERLSRREIAEAEYGIGLSYLLEDRPERAAVPLAIASQNLTGPSLQECNFLLKVINGTCKDAPADLLARLDPYLGDEALASIKTASANTSQIGLARHVDVSRASWAANPLRGNHSPMQSPTRITIHHSAEPLTSNRLAATRAEVRRLQGIHQDHRNWADIGYHFLIDRAGRVVEGRPLDIQGAHAGNASLNAGNIGICLLGNFAPQPERGPDFAIAQKPTAEQFATLEQLTKSLMSEFGIPSSNIVGHGELKETECPGPALRVWVRQNF